MNFFENELQKIVDTICPTATYVGQACFIELTEMNRAKIEFVSTRIHQHYDAIQATILNLNEGKIDSIRLNFADIWGKKKVNNPNFPDGIEPYAWTYRGTDWYVYHPTRTDYLKLQNRLLDYLLVYDYRKDRKLSLDAKITESASKSGQAKGKSGEKGLDGPRGR